MAKVKVKTKSPSTGYKIDERSYISGQDTATVEMDDKITRAIRAGVLVVVQEEKAEGKVKGKSKIDT